MTLASTARITLDRLEGACDDQRVMFQELFPNGFEATSEAECVAAARKHALAFDWWRASEILLTDPAGEAYEAAERSAWEAYKSVKRPAWKAYEAAKRPAMKAYEAACADAFARAFWAQESTQ